MTFERAALSAFLLATLIVCAHGASHAAPAPLHPYHLSTAEVECNTKKQQLEVSLAVLAIDFEETLSRRAGKRINLDRTKNIDKLIEKYLAEHFAVTLPDGSKPKPSYVGHEDAKKLVWIYFTVPLVAKKPKVSPKSKKPSASLLVGTRLKNTVLMELNKSQRNTVILREGTWRRPMLFERKTKEQVLRPEKPRPRGQK